MATSSDRCVRALARCVGSVLVGVLLGGVGTSGHATTQEARGLSPASSDVEAQPRNHPIRRLPARRHGHSAQVVGGTLYVLGGYGRERDATRGVLRLDLDDPAADWSRAADLQEPHRFAASVVVDDRMIVVGPTVEQYDPQADAWDVLGAGLDLPRSHFAAATGATGSEIHVLGGFPEAAGTYRTLDPATGTVTPGPAVPGWTPGEHLHLVAVVGTRLHVVGGLHGETTQPMTAHRVLEDGRWRDGPPVPAPVDGKFGVCAVVDDRLVVLHGGRAHVLDAAGESWTTAETELPAWTAMAAAVAVDDTVLVIGGLAEDDDGRAILRYEVAPRAAAPRADSPRPATPRPAGHTHGAPTHGAPTHGAPLDPDAH